MKTDSPLWLETLAIHAGQPADKQSGAVMTPISLATTFVQDGPGNLRDGFAYARGGNPTRKALETCLAELEGADHGFAFSSGMAAETTLFLSLKPGDHVVACDEVYGGTYRVVEHVIKKLGIDVSWVDLSDPHQLKHALKPNTRMVWLETPTNPTLKLIDVKAICLIAHGHGAKVILDNTFATPVLQRAFDLGVDAVVHSTTKYLNGHSDVIGGAVITRDPELATQIKFLQNTMGGVPSPFDCYMVLRGIKTLCVRMKQSCESAQVLAEWLQTQPQVAKVHYSGLASHPQHALCKTQMTHAGGMVAFEVKGGGQAARKLLTRLNIFACAESLGGVESLMAYPWTMSHGAMPEAQKLKLGITEGLLRMSVGLEAVTDLKTDLAQALEQ